MASRLRGNTQLLVAVLLAATASLVFAHQSDYIIGPKDVLAISVWDQPDMTGKWTVEADGSFTFPLAGRVKAAGLTLRQFEAALKKRLVDGGFFRDPQVSVAVDQYVSQQVVVVGEVRSPGPITLTGDMTLVEVLARAGAPPTGEVVIVHTRDAKTPSGAVPPPGQDGQQPIRVNLRDLQDGNLARNIPLRDGDTISVTNAETVYVTGQVRNPGAYPLRTKDTTVQQALALAGGVTDRGARNRVRITRVVDGKTVDIKVKLTDLVQPGDTILVPDRWI